MNDWLKDAQRVPEIDGAALRSGAMMPPVHERRPFVMRALVPDWPAVVAARSGMDAIAALLRRYGSGAAVNVFTAPPHVKGRYFFRPDMQGFNFHTEQATLGALLDRLSWAAGQADPPSFYAGSATASDFMPGFVADNVLPIDAPGATPRLWTGNASNVATHFDQSDNIAVVVSGTRRFVMFPPQEVGNLYLGPLNRTPAGQPVSMVDVDAPDMARFPRFADAMQKAQVALLEPGDAIFMPSLWWHTIRATGPLNLMVNYWYNQDAGSSPLLAFAHALLAIRDRPPEERAAWRAWFDHFVFDDDAAHAADHLPGAAKGVQGPPSPGRDETIRSFVVRGLMGRT